MRHGKTFNHLGRKSAHRKALLKNLACALIEHKRITTTLAKAKALRLYIEPLLTKSKTNDTHSRRVVFSYLQNKEAIKELFGPVAEKIGDRPGGYVRVIRTGFRRTDGSEMAMIELVDFNEIYNQGEDSGKSSKRRRRRGGSGKSTAGAAEAAPKVEETDQAEVEENESTSESEDEK
jgi:large subunit ribosomal protein L17